MKIIVDDEGRKRIEQLCDVALKMAGVQNLNGVNETLESLETYTEPEKLNEKKE